MKTVDYGIILIQSEVTPKACEDPNFYCEIVDSKVQL